MIGFIHVTFSQTEEYTAFTLLSTDYSPRLLAPRTVVCQQSALAVSQQFRLRPILLFPFIPRLATTTKVANYIFILIKLIFLTSLTYSCKLGVLLSGISDFVF